MFKFRTSASSITTGAVVAMVVGSLSANLRGSTAQDGTHDSGASKIAQQGLRRMFSIISHCDASSFRFDGSNIRNTEGMDETLGRLLFPRCEDFWSKGHDKNMLLRYDPSLRNPKWVLEHITSRGRHAAVADSRKSMHFHTDSIVAAAVEAGIAPPASMVHSDAYRGWGWDRGHLAPSADHKASVEHMRGTFTMCNVSPQDAAFNRGVWLRMEEWVRSLVNCDDNKEEVDVFVLSGPAFLPGYVSGQWISAHKTIGEFPQLIHVPTHFFKVIVRIVSPSNSTGNKDAAVEVGAFLFPHRDIDAKIPIQTFAVSFADLEAALGYSLFGALLSAGGKDQLDWYISNLPNRQSFDRELAEGVFSLRPEDNAYAFVHGGAMTSQGYVRNSNGDSGNKGKKWSKPISTGNSTPRMIEVPRLLLQDSTYSNDSSSKIPGDVIRGYLRHLCAGGKCNDHRK